ncbi:NAD(P)/FAD-dependent oxidoreductase [Bailinhaonella thermotolerans]|uniref:NAD(P)/FAD-dependent oxidoreductase n=1 Tax=Bailinhaonella thermotolerans TaxID=1070861 RepID=UPI001F5B161B|nr:FAD-dependent oxidoreductase [Bailinhaonella thermotolerans]
MRVVVVGAGIVGAACAYYLTRAGIDVVVVERGAVASGTTGAGEGNVLVSDKGPGPELDLAARSAGLWRELAEEVGGFEYEPKGGLVVAGEDGARAALEEFAAGQRAAGVEADVVPAGDLRGYEPHLSDGHAGGVFYPGDAQVHPMLAAARLLRASGAATRFGTAVTGLIRHGDRVAGVRTPGGDIAADAVVNAAGTWSGDVARLAGVDLPVLPRRGFVLVTEPLPPLVRHKVYTAAYVTDVASDSADLETSAVVEGTPSGTVLIGASRERVGFDRSMPVAVLERLAAQAVALFPALADARVIRAYRGFRPYCPDHLPVIGPDPRAPGLWHAAGHEGAGIGLAPATADLLTALLTGRDPVPGTGLDPAPFRPERFAEEAA